MKKSILKMLICIFIYGMFNTVCFATGNEGSTFANTPQVLSGMIPVKYNGTNWVITNTEDVEWFDYSSDSMKWANVMLRDEAKYLDFDGVTLQDIGSTDLDYLIGREVPTNQTGSMYVWIPRFSYKIDNSSVSIKYSEGLTDNISDDFKVHPAFNYAQYLGGDVNNDSNYESNGDLDKYLGLWVAKYPAGKSISTPKYSAASTEIKNMTVGEAFTASKLTAQLTRYGINSDTSSGISHMMKNSEWGAVAYFTTANGNLSNNSTTGNIYGIYGMDSGAEYVSDYIELVGGISNNSVRVNGLSLIPYTMIKYNHTSTADIRDIEPLKLKSYEDSKEANYNTLANYSGFGINEVGEAITGSITKDMPSGSNAFFVRGIDGMYSYSGTDGSGASDIGFRNVILAENENANSTKTHIIRATSDEGIKISPQGNTTVKSGSDITYVIKSISGREISDVTVDGVSVLNNLVDNGSYYTYKFENVSADHEIYVYVKVEETIYNVSVEKNPEAGGEVDGMGSYRNNDTVMLRANIASGYKFASWEVLEGIEETIPNLTSREISFSMPGNNVILKANFEKILKAILSVETVNSRTYGEESVDALLNIVAKSRDGYEFAGWDANGIELTQTELNNDTLEKIMPSNDISFIAKYRENVTSNVIVIVGTTESVTEYKSGETVAISVSPVLGNTYLVEFNVEGIDEVQVNGSVVTFTMPSNDVIIEPVYM